MTYTIFAGGIYIDGNTPVRESGEISVRDTEIVFVNANQEVRFLITNTDIRFGGTANRTIYLSHPSEEKITLHITDFSFLKHPAFTEHAAALSVKQGRQKHHTTLGLTLAVLAFIILIPSYFVFIERTIVAGVVAKRIPFSVEKTIGDHIFNLQFAKGSQFIKDPDVLKDLDILLSPLLSTAQNAEYDFQVHIMKEKSANAFALPGGHIVLLTGLIDEAENPEELLGVVAHEMAHVTKRHSLQQVVSELSGYLLLNIITSGAGDLVFAMGTNARFLLSKDFSRTQEKEADTVGFNYLIQAGISPKGLISYFEKLKEKNKLFDLELFTMIRTHPSSEKRMQNLGDMLQKYDGSFKDVAFPYIDFKEKISALSDLKSTELTNETSN